MIYRTAHFSTLALTAALLVTGCGKATVRPGTSDDGFSLSMLRSAPSAVIIDAEVSFSDLTPSYQSAFNSRFGTEDSLTSYLSAVLIDSLNRGTPRVPAALAPALNPRHILIIRDLVVARGARGLPSTLLPTGGQKSMQSAGGGTSESWTVSFVVNVWESAREFHADSVVVDTTSFEVPDSTSGLLRYSFAVSGSADVPLYAYKTALIEAVNAAVTQTARQLRKN